jgi:hypothetical protein
MAQVCWAVLRPLLLGVGCVVTNDDEERKRLLSCNSVGGLYPSGGMTHKHEEQIPAALESVVARLGELEVVIGAHVGPLVAAVRSLLITAMAARDRGDMPTAVARIGEAMDTLSAVAARLDPAEATLMRSLAHNFRAALLRGDATQAHQSAAFMFEKSGAVQRKKD